MRCAVIAVLAVVGLTGTLSPAGGQAAGPAGPAAPGAVADSLRRQIDASLRTNELGPLRTARLAVERALKSAPEDAWLQYYRAYATFREVGLLVTLGQSAEAGKVVEPAMESLERAMDKKPTDEGLALLSTLYGQRLSASGSRWMMLRMGPTTLRTMDRAVVMGPQSPRVWVLKGIAAFSTPGFLGGGADKAEASLRKAIALFATDRPVPPAPSWGEADAWLWLGRALQAQGNVGEARHAYARALELQPWNLWLSKTLIPSLGKS